MRRSEIYDNFVKIAQDKGMLKTASDTAKDIEDKYDVKTDPEQKDKNMIEIAHPNSLVIHPSYDKLNGLVENNQERQNIILNIVKKHPDGLQTQRKYASDELVLSLVRVANDLDNHNKENLFRLADTCLFQASAGLKKQAFYPVVIGVAALLGLMYAKNHLKFHSDGFKQDFMKLNGEIDDLLMSNSSTQTAVGAGYEYTPEFLKTVSDLKAKINDFANLVNKITPVMENIQQPRTGKELLDLSKKPETQAGIAAYKEFRESFDNLLPYINKIEQNFSNPGYKSQAIQEKGWMSSVIDSAEILHGGKGLIADDFDDVVHALQTFMGDAVEIAKFLQNADSLEKGAQVQLQQATADADKKFENKDTAVEKEPAHQVADLEKELSSLPGLS